MLSGVHVKQATKKKKKRIRHWQATNQNVDEALLIWLELKTYKLMVLTIFESGLAIVTVFCYFIVIFGFLQASHG